MTWLAIVNWRKYQSYQCDEPRYIKLFVHVLDDKKVQGLKPLTRLLWYQLLPLASRYQNAIPYNVSAIAKELRLERHSTGESIKELLGAGLVREAKARRRMYEIARKPPEELAENFLRNGGYNLTIESLREEFVQRGVSSEDSERLLDLARRLAA